MQQLVYSCTEGLESIVVVKKNLTSNLVYTDNIMLFINAKYIPA